ncbi:hypothetical protein N6H14_29540 [Paenibacillus sp. CC-CFT747]|nr:hypothetical protein N6H14_29540 [Paenibacillus sp. CC-CFT747]
MGDGGFDSGEDDGLYWRTFGDSVTDLFGLTGSGGTEWSLGDSGDTPVSGPAEKLAKAASIFPLEATGELRFTNKWVERKVEARVKQSFHQGNLFQPFAEGDHYSAEAISYVTDPVDFTRNVDLLAEYSGRLKQFFDSGRTAKDILLSGEEKPALVIRSEAEASQYIRRLVNGKSVVLETDTVGQSRKIDALDGDGIAHEAKYTVNEADARQQIQKDVELIRRGLIKGAVWHFFRHARKGTVALSPGLRQELERNGILVVIHN